MRIILKSVRVQTKRVTPLLIGAALLIGGCGAVESEEPEVRILHLSPDAPPVAIYLDDDSSPLATIEFGQSTDYALLEAGPHQLAVGTTGAPDTAQLQTGDINFDGGRFTAVAIGRVADIEAIVFPDGSAGLAQDAIRVRAIHAAPDVGQVDVLNIAPDGTATELTKNLDFGDFSGDLDVPAGAYTIGIDLDNDAKAELYFELPELDAGTLANVFVTQDANDNVLAYAQLGGSTTAAIVQATTTLRIVHGSRDAPNVDVRANGLDIATNLEFASSTDVITLSAGNADLEVLPTGSSTPVLSVENVSFLPSRSYTVIAYGDVSPVTSSTGLRAAVLLDDTNDVADDRVRLQVFHAAPGVEEGDVYSLNENGGVDTNLVPDLAFGGVGSAPDLPKAPYAVGFEADASGLIIADFEVPALTASAANIFIIQDQSDSVFLLAQLAGSSTALICESDIASPCSLSQP